MKSFKISSDCHIKACQSLKWRAILKETMLFLLAFKSNLYEKAFSCVKRRTNCCRKPCWNAERSNHLFLSNWWIKFFKHWYSLIMWQYNIEVNWLCEHRKKVRNSQACISINSCTELSKTKFFLYFPLSHSKYSLEPQHFLRGLPPLNPLLRGSDPQLL